MKKLFIISLVFITLLLSACNCSAATTNTPGKISLADYVTVMDSSSVLPDSFKPVDVAAEHLTRVELGLEPTCSEITAYLSQDSPQLIYSYYAIFEEPTNQSEAEAKLKDEAYLTNAIQGSLTTGISGVSPDDVLTQINHPVLADYAVSGEGIISISGIDHYFNLFWFRSGKVFVYFQSFSDTPVKQSLEPLAREALNRLSQYTQ